MQKLYQKTKDKPQTTASNPEPAQEYKVSQTPRQGSALPGVWFRDYIFSDSIFFPRGIKNSDSAGPLNLKGSTGGIREGTE